MAVIGEADIAAVVNAMLGVLGKGSAELAQYAESEARKIAQSIETINTLCAAGEISREEAAAQLTLQKNASQTVFTSVQGIGAVLAVQAINAGLQAVGGIVNATLGFALV